MTPAAEQPDRPDAARLLDAMRQPDTLSHAEAENLIALLVEAEAMGEDVDDDPTFASLFRHLDHCGDCLALYEQLAEEYTNSLAQQLGHTAVAEPLLRPSKPARSVGQVWRTFEIVLRQPLRQPQRAIHERQAEYGSASVPPDVQIDVSEDEHGTTLRVQILDITENTSWLITVTTDVFHAQAQTDTQGIATFQGVPASDIVRVSGDEQPTS